MKYRDFILELTTNVMKLASYLDVVKDTVVKDDSQVQSLQKIQVKLTDIGMSLALMDEAMPVEIGNVELE